MKVVKRSLSRLGPGVPLVLAVDGAGVHVASLADGVVGAVLAAVLGRDDEGASLGLDAAAARDLRRPPKPV